MARSSMTAVAILGLVLAASAAFAASARRGAAADGYVLEGVEVEGFPDLGPLPRLEAGATVGVQRLTFEIGGHLDLPYQGPTLFYVERGTLGLPADGRRRLAFPAGGDASRGRPLPPTAVDGEIRLTTGQGVSAEDGDLGPVRNAGDGPLVVLALLVVPAPGPGEYESESAETTAVPATAPTTDEEG